MRWRAVALGVVMCVGGGLGATALAHDTEPPPLGERCVQGAGVLPGGPFVFAGAVNAGTGIPCRYTARVPGGYVATGTEWRVVVEKLDGRTRVFSSARGSSACWEDVIDEGDVVEAWSTGAVVAGEGVVC